VSWPLAVAPGSSSREPDEASHRRHDHGCHAIFVPLSSLILRRRGETEGRRMQRFYSYYNIYVVFDDTESIIHGFMGLYIYMCVYDVDCVR